MGIHHITAIAGDPQRNLDFYTGVLGLRLIKVTVNFDDPASYHFYYGDEVGRPGSILTFFPWPGARRGRPGTGQAATVSLAIPPGSLGFWIERLLAQGIKYEGPTRRFDEQVLTLNDPDGLLVELVATPRVADAPAWSGGSVQPEHGIRGLLGTTLWEDGETGTAELLTETLGFTPIGEADGVQRFESGSTGPGTVVDLRRATGFWRGVVSVGTVHHVAFRATTDEAQLQKRTEIESRGLGITPVIDRQYFHSVYFREPGGVLFEIATDGPGFTIDESVAELGTHLRLPPMYQSNRSEIESALPAIRLPHQAPEGLIHRFVPGSRPGAVPLLLLHGTGGDENDLVSLGEALAPGAPLLSPRGQVLEQGMSRFFRRHAEGVFDIEDLKFRARELAEFVTTSRERYSLGDIPPIAVGLSNGANIAGALLLLHPGTLSAALLLRPMVPLVPDTLPDLSDVRVLIAAARQDPIASPAQSEELADLLRRAGADVTLHWSEAGHGLTQEDVLAGQRWMEMMTATR
jgi:predicted esterase/catechol 2,3-dioxygenase-like lactoylglutathione lyase family enzyme